MRGITVLLILVLATGCVSAEDYMSLWWNTTAKEIISGVAVGDATGDGYPEIAVSGSSDGLVYLFSHDGRLIWKKDVFSYINTIGLADINADGKKEVIAGYADLSVFDSTGERILKYKTPYGMGVYRVIDAHLSDDKKQDIIFASYDIDSCSREKPSSVYAVDGNGNEIWRYSLEYNVPEALVAEDLNGDGRDEIFIGTIYRSAGSNKVCRKKYNEPANVIVLNPDGTLLWNYQTNGGVLAIAVGDVEEDSKPEVAVGAYPALHLLSNDGRLLWSDTTHVNTYVEDVVVLDLDDDGKEEVVAASADVTAFDQGGKPMWSGTTDSRVYSLAKIDLDDDKKEEVVAGSGSVYVFSREGIERWRSQSHTSYGFLRGDDLDRGGFGEIIAGSVKSIFVYRTQEYAKRVRADQLFESAKTGRGGDYAIAELTEAKKLYSELGLIDNAAECVNQIENIKAVSGRVEEVKAEGETALNASRELMVMGDYINSSRYAQIARMRFSSLNMQELKDEADAIIEELKSKITENATYELILANKTFHEGDYLAALNHARIAQQHYAFIGDLDRAEKAGILADNIKEISGLTEGNETTSEEELNSGFNLGDISSKAKSLVSEVNPLHLAVAVGLFLTLMLVILMVVAFIKIQGKKKTKIKHQSTQHTVESEEPTNGFRKRRVNVIRYSSKDIKPMDDVKNGDLNVEMPKNRGVFKAGICRQGLCLKTKKIPQRK
ncbi:MAG: VCBS repeat-containing protein [Candidatus Altiarchaeota archaeon]|nr:VCBS repeat-containing protein [Candidatus Altiarchaeota archaeon]